MRIRTVPREGMGGGSTATVGDRGHSTLSLLYHRTLKMCSEGDNEERNALDQTQSQRKELTAVVCEEKHVLQE